MKPLLVVDASIAAKWVVPEPQTDLALSLAKAHLLCAPDLIFPECANILWKKVQKGQVSRDAALAAARVLEHADMEIVATRTFTAAAADLAIALDHPAYDCIYLALAEMRGLKLVTADERLLRKLAQGTSTRCKGQVLSLSEAAAAMRTESSAP